MVIALVEDDCRDLRSAQRQKLFRTERVETPIDQSGKTGTN